MHLASSKVPTPAARALLARCALGHAATVRDATARTPRTSTRHSRARTCHREPCRFGRHIPVTPGRRGDLSDGPPDPRLWTGAPVRRRAT
jgi:hypothetical protein